MGGFNDKFESKRQDWETPDDIFTPLDEEFNFTLDVAASDNNRKCNNWFTDNDDGLNKDWKINGKPAKCWMNPPFKVQSKWVKKAYKESKKGVTTVCLLPARTNTNWFHDYCLKYGEVRFIRGRPKFKGAEHGLPQPLAIVIFHGDSDG